MGITTRNRNPSYRRSLALGYTDEMLLKYDTKVKGGCLEYPFIGLNG